MANHLTPGRSVVVIDRLIWWSPLLGTRRAIRPVNLGNLPLNILPVWDRRTALLLLSAIWFTTTMRRTLQNRVQHVTVQLKHMLTALQTRVVCLLFRVTRFRIIPSPLVGSRSLLRLTLVVGVSPTIVLREKHPIL